MTSNTGKSTSYQLMEKLSICDRRYTMKSFADSGCEFHDESTSATNESIVINRFKAGNVLIQFSILLGTCECNGRDGRYTITGGHTV